MAPGSPVPTKPASGYDGVTSPYGYYDWIYVDGTYSKIPFAFPPEPDPVAGGTWQPLLQYQALNVWWPYTTTSHIAFATAWRGIWVFPTQSPAALRRP